MAQIGRLQYGAKETARSVADNPTFEKLTRVGFAAKGAVYVMIGFLAFKYALGDGGETTDRKGAINNIASQPFGEFALAFIAVGLLAYEAWRLFSAFADTEHDGTDGKGLAKRFLHAGSGLLYATSGVYAFRVLTGNGSGGGGDKTQTWTARILDAPGGEFLLALIGLAIICGGGQQVYKGWSEKFGKHLGTLSHSRLVTSLGKWGYIARGVVFAVIGFLVVMAAVRNDASNVKGTEGALDTLAAEPWLLAAVAAGLICYGGYCFIEARYRRVRS